MFERVGGAVSSGKQLKRSRNAYAGGVCAGIADCCDLDLVVVRIIACIVVVATCGLGLLVYLIMWAVIPLEAEGPAPVDVEPEHVESKAYGRVRCDRARGRTAEVSSAAAARLQADLARGFPDQGHLPPEPPAGAAPAAATSASAVSADRSAVQNPSEALLPAAAQETADQGKLSLFGRIAIAFGMLALFYLVAKTGSPIVPGTQWWQFWPFSLVIAGLFLIVLPVGSTHRHAWHMGGAALVALGGALAPVSLGIFAWETWIVAFVHMWPLLAGAIGLFATGVVRSVSPLMLGGAVCFVAFVLLGLLFFQVPGAVEGVVLTMPNGRPYSIVGLCLS